MRHTGTAAVGSQRQFAEGRELSASLWNASLSACVRAPEFLTQRTQMYQCAVNSHKLKAQDFEVSLKA